MRHLMPLFLLALAAPAAALTQPNGVVIPTPPVYCSGGSPGGLGALFACQCLTPGTCNIGAACPGGSTSCDDGQNGTCETTIWHDVNDNSCIPSNLSGLDPVAEASVTPATFRPTCPLTFTVTSRHEAMFKNAFGWYNVSGSRPDVSDLHVMLDCSAPEGAEVVLDLRNEPDYAGGDVGFFIVTPESHTQPLSCARGDCCATLSRLGQNEGYVYYSESQHNPDHVGANSIIHLLIYNSHITARKFYFAWEDIHGGSDNEFMDLVTSVEGVECSGAGVACDTGLPGACSYGVTTCATGTVTCTQVYQAGTEVCDGLDNDCDGVIDDGAMCPDGQVCQEGRCVPHCTVGGEFDCPNGMTCNPASGFCREEGCAEFQCPPNTICRNGQCIGGCDDVVCPTGQSCRLGFCVAPCAGVSCGPGEVCAEGLCVAGCAECGGILCNLPLRCDTATGGCYDPSCPDGCPTGTHCDQGTCVDNCVGAVCPGGQTCVAGSCVQPGAGGRDGGLAPGNDGSDSTDGPDLGNHLTPQDGAAGCGCRAAGASPGLAALALLALALVLARRRST
jgi:MYXO-CTERM domain-containing protein